jgi:SAM-dependent methyltransferase
LIINKADAVFRVEGDKVAFNQERLEYLYPHQSYDIPLPAGSVDYVFSNSVLEHITDLEPTATNIFRVLPSGGLTAHHIDMRDHRDFERPLEFLKIDAETWKQRRGSTVTAAAGYNTNRLRLSDFIAALEKSGFRILKSEVTRKVNVTEETRASLHADFQKYSLEDLSVVSAMIVAEKP